MRRPEAATERSSATAPAAGSVDVPVPRREIRALTGLRLFAALWVVLFHFHFTPGAAVAAVYEPLAPFIGTGALGVDLFFILSGFVIALTYLDRLGPRPRMRPTVSYLWARMSRIWPVYAVVTTLFGAFVVTKMLAGTDSNVAFQPVQPEVSIASWLEQMFMVQMWARPSHDGASWVGPAWSLSAEWLVYLLFPLFAWAFVRAARLPRWVLAVAAVGVLLPMAWVSLRTGTPYFSFSWLVRVLGGFFSGVLAYLVVRRLPRTERVRRWATWVAWAAVLAIPVGL